MLSIFLAFIIHLVGHNMASSGVSVAPPAHAHMHVSDTGGGPAD